MTTTVRPATLADAPRLSRLGATTFRETFEGENSPEDMARYLADAFAPEKQAAEIADPAAYGFERVGEHTFVLGADPQTDWVLARALA